MAVPFVMNTKLTNVFFPDVTDDFVDQEPDEIPKCSRDEFSPSQIYSPRQRAVPGLPPSLVATDLAAGQLRAYLDSDEALRHYHVYYCGSPDMDDLDELLPVMSEPDAAWEPLPTQVPNGHRPAQLTYDDTTTTARHGGILRLARHDAVIARWYWAPVEDYGEGILWLVATPSAAAFHALRKTVLSARRRNNGRHWQVMGDYRDKSRPARDPASAATPPVLADSILRRVRAELLGFFDSKVANLYHGLGVPYRRGVLLHGPPGNGKTSLIRWIGASLGESVAAMTLRPRANFDGDDFQELVKDWAAQAPALLVLEDLDTLLEQVNVSTFLNLLDGIDVESPQAGGLLLIATTNHPDKLDPAVNNRPGRFDAVIELPRPDADLRLRFLRPRLVGSPLVDDAAVAKVVDLSDGLSFAHLQELLRLSGLRAIHAGRAERLAEDLLSAVVDVKAAHDAAVRGFPPDKPDVAFGLAHLRDLSRQQR